VLEACLGLSFHPEKREIRFDKAQLPARIDTLDIVGLELAGAQVELVLRRYPNTIGVEVRKRDGDISIVVAK